MIMLDLIDNLLALYESSPWCDWIIGEINAILSQEITL